jgi:transmembrane sensor
MDLQQWVSRRPVHRQYLDEMQHILGVVEEIKDTPPIFDSALRAAVHAQRMQDGDPTPGIFRWRISSRLAIAAGLALVMITVVHLLLGGDAAVRYTTMVGEQRDIALEDGSVAYLNTDTAVRVTYSNEMRSFELERGQAMFTVMRDPARPFVVSANGVSVTALGTEFDVYRSGAQTSVAVLRGTVEVSGKDKKWGVAAGPKWRETLTSGKGITVSQESGAREITVIDTHRVASWRNETLEFSDLPLAAAIAEFNRYTHRHLVIGDERLKDIRISAVFKIHDQEEFIQVLGILWKVRAEQSSEGDIVLRAGDRP